MLLIHPAAPALDLLLVAAVPAGDPPRRGEGHDEDDEHPRVGDGLLQPGFAVSGDDPLEHEQEDDGDTGVDPADEMGGEALEAQPALEEGEGVAGIAGAAQADA